MFLEYIDSLAVNIDVDINCHVYNDHYYCFQSVLKHVIHRPISFGIRQIVTRLSHSHHFNVLFKCFY